MSNPKIKQAIAQHFNRGAVTYDAASSLQRTVGHRMLERLQFFKINPETILELGTSTGNITHALKKIFPKANRIGLDISHNMLTCANTKNPWFNRPAFICADMEMLPFSDNSMDIVCANVTIQWTTNLNDLLSEIKRVLTPNGLWLFTTFGPDTLKELRQHVPEVQINTFTDMHDIGDSLLGNHFSNPVLDVEYIVCEYDTPMKVLSNLKKLGANYSFKRTQKGLGGKKILNQIIENYPQHENKQYPATFEIIYGHAFAPAQETFSAPNNIAHIPVSSIKRKEK